MNIEQARFNMIEQQIRPWNVLDERVLETLAYVHREDFVAASQVQVAFADLSLPIEIDGRRTGEFMLNPKVEARMLQAVLPLRHETVLEIGSGTGYGTALLARHARQVSSLESNPAIAAVARANLKRAGVVNATVLESDGAGPRAAGTDLFDVIVLSGSVHKVPGSLLERLQVGGRLVAITGDEPSMHARLYRRNSERDWSSTDEFDASAPRLHGFRDRSSFTF